MYERYLKINLEIVGQRFLWSKAGEKRVLASCEGISRYKPKRSPCRSGRFGLAFIFTLSHNAVVALKVQLKCITLCTQRWEKGQLVRRLTLLNFRLCNRARLSIFEQPLLIKPSRSRRFGSGVAFLILMMAALNTMCEQCAGECW